MVVHNLRATRDLRAELLSDHTLSDSERKKVLQLADLLEKMLLMDPEKRISPRDAIEHPFISEPF